VRVLVTGADGFVGRYLTSHLLEQGHEVVGARHPGGPPPLPGTPLRWVPLELDDDESVRAAVDRPLDAVVHLAAIASGRDARRDPGRAWTVNAAGTARLAEALAARGGAGGPRLLLVSTGEVYGGAAPLADGQPRPLREDDAVVPLSPYAASKVGAEIAAQEVARRTGLPLVTVRAFAHTGPGQAELYVVPAFAARLREARRTGAAQVRTGNLDPVRDILDVRDVVRAYAALLERGAPGETYNVASGEGITLRELFARMTAVVGIHAEPAVDPALSRASDIPHLVGDAAKLRAATGWTPSLPLDRTLRDVVDAQEN